MANRDVGTQLSTTWVCLNSSSFPQPLRLLIISLFSRAVGLVVYNLSEFKHVRIDAPNGSAPPLRYPLVRPQTPSNQVTFRTSFQNCVLKALTARKWRQIETTGWSLQWSEKERVNDVFEEGLTPTQRCNHFRLWGQVRQKQCSSAARICS